MWLSQLDLKVGGLIDGYGAKEAGLQVADKILTVDDKRVDIWEDLQQAVRNRKKNKIECFAKVLRGNQELKFNVFIKDKALNDQLGSVFRILGISPFDEIMKLNTGF